jgi:hypothetical protein
MDEHKAQALRDWRAKRMLGTPLELDSGLTVIVKRAELLDLAANGEIPAPLLGTVERLANEGAAKVEMADLPEFAALVNLVVRATVVEPPIADEPDDEHLGIKELSFSEKMVIFNHAQQAIAGMKPFRGESEAGVPAAQSG